MKKILILVAHTDDAELGMAPMIVKHIQDGDMVKVVSFSPIPESLPSNMRDPNQLVIEHRCAMKILGVNDWIVLDIPGRVFSKHDAQIRDIIYHLVNVSYRPDRVYTHCKSSEHQDHAVMYRCTRNVLSKSTVGFWTFSLPGDSISFAPNEIIALNRGLHIQPYLDCLKCYVSQRSRKWWDEKVFVARALYWSPHRSGVKWSWPFEVEKI